MAFTNTNGKSHLYVIIKIGKLGTAILLMNRNRRIENVRTF